MKKYVILSLFIIAVVLGGIFFYKRRDIISIFQNPIKESVDSFEIPAKNIPECYPIEIVDYNEIDNKEDGLMIFGRALWSKKVNGEMKGKPAIVPVEFYQKNDETGELELINSAITNQKDGHIVFIIKKPDKKYVVRIDYKNAENCPEELKSSSK
jgi:hypothetical protein